MSGQVKLGFGDRGLSAIAHAETGTLLCRDGRTATLGPPVVEWHDADRSWRARVDGGFDVVLRPLGEPAQFADGSQEWLCEVDGAADGTPIDCLGHIVLAGDGPPTDWRKTGLERGVAAWFAADLAFAVHARRPARADAHEAEALEAIVLRGEPPAPVAIDDPRLSTAYDGDGRARRAGLELWETEESDFALRLAAETIGEGELVLPGGAVVRSAFLLWRYDGMVGTGRYDIGLAPR
ncbi:MAG TPA: hypothetical protein VG165_12245 [Solirubrobacteraceae bacterium]|jgi:hypothetical protein|nr:hypothetical protein [Solirubrobacteraceae bacterium]